MHVDQAVVFVQVVESGSFTAAAARLDMPKSTVSRRVSQLEERLGVRLLQRTTRKLRLTHEGEAYYRRAAQALATLGDAEQAVLQSLDTPRGTLRVSAPVDLSRPVGVLVARFCQAYPEVHVSMDFSQRKVDLVGEGFDVALRGGTLADSSLIARLLAPSMFGLYASRDYLDAHGTPACLAELSSHRCLLFGHSHHDVWHLDGPRGPEEVAVQGPVAGNDFIFLWSLARAGAGIAWLPLARSDEGPLVRVLPDYRQERGGLYAVYPSTENLVPRVRVFVDFLARELPSVPLAPGA